MLLFYRCKIFYQILAQKGWTKKVILHEHAADFVEFYQNSNDQVNIRETLNKCDCLIVLSDSWKKYFSSIGVDKSKISVLNNIVPPPNFRDSPRKDNKLHLMFMGEISMRKGGFDLLQAISDNKEYFKR